MSNIEWKAVVGYEGLYEVSNDGRVRSLDRQVERVKRNGDKYTNTVKGHELTPYTVGQGYLRVDLYKYGKRTHKKVHRLVAEAFLKKIPGKESIDHKNTDKTDNRVENLHWVTQKENMNNPLTIEKIKQVMTGKKRNRRK